MLDRITLADVLAHKFHLPAEKDGLDELPSDPALSGFRQAFGVS
jgi:hypothetical protein